MNSHAAAVGSSPESWKGCARFLCGAEHSRHFPADTGREIAFAGRSNAGKSSAINRLMNNKKLARCGRTPGCTQQINFFELGADTRLVDLPGYGYARMPESRHQALMRLLGSYLSHRSCLRGVVLLSDARHPLGPLDQDFLAQLSENEIPCALLLTKSDKLSRNGATAILHQTRDKIENYPFLQHIQLFSSLNGSGIDKFNAILRQWTAEKL